MNVTTGFRLDGIEGWERRSTFVFLSPPLGDSEDSLPPTLHRVEPVRSTVVLQQQPNTYQDTLAACWAILNDPTNAAVPDFEVLKQPEPLMFEDGAPGAVATAAGALPQNRALRIRQVYAVRIDDGLLTQLVGTYDETGGAAADGAMRVLLTSFKPGAGQPTDASPSP